MTARRETGKVESSVKNWNRRALSALLTLTAVLTLSGTALAAGDPEVQEGDIVILHTNDVHCGIEDGLTYAGVSAYAGEMEARVGEENVTLVDAGDAVQGGPIGTLTQGEYLVEIMNQVGYDVFTPGNHEFDYQIPRLLELTGMLDARTISSNFVDLATGESVFEPYTILDYGEVQVAYVGITTPESFTKSTPAYFQDGNGNYIYGFCEGNSGRDLYDNVQASVDAARAEGADYVVAVAHLGVEETSAPWRSTDVIANTHGIDVMIDGHSHSTIDGQEVSNENGETVLLNQTGTKLAALGEIVIDPDTGEITAGLVTDYAGRDSDTQTFIDAINMEFDGVLNQVVAGTDVPLTTVDPVTGQRIIRSQETNLGDLCADAYRSVLGADVALVNGGGIRADIPAGDITYGQIINVHPYSNQATSVRVTGQQLLDALELGAQNTPGESGGFLQVSGMTYTIDTTIPSSVVTDDKGNFVRVDGAYRVKDVTVGGEPLDLERTYVVASHDYMLLDGGDGMVMFAGAEVVKDRVMPDNEVLIQYIRDTLGGVVGQEYAVPYGQGRITVLTQGETETPVQPQEPENPADPQEPDSPVEPQEPEGSASDGRSYVVRAGDCLWTIASRELGSGTRWNEIYELNRDILSDPDWIYVGQELELPAA